jgi:hypothetical protein
MNGGCELNGADKCQSLACFKIKLYRIDQMTQIDLDVNEYVEHFDAVRNIDGNFKERKERNG